MNCDQAFDSLTDPAQRDSAELQRHLHDCPRCRDLADALEPALQLFDEARQGGTSPEMLSSCNSWYEDDGIAPMRPNAAGSRSGGWDEPGVWNARSEHDRRRARIDGLKVASVLLLVGALTAAVANVDRESPTPLARIAEIDTAACLRTQLDSKNTTAAALAACVACHLDADESAKLSYASRVRAQHLVQQCVACHLELSAGQELAHATDADRPPSLVSYDAADINPCLRLSVGG